MTPEDASRDSLATPPPGSGLAMAAVLAAIGVALLPVVLHPTFETPLALSPLARLAVKGLLLALPLAAVAGCYRLELPSRAPETRELPRPLLFLGLLILTVLLVDLHETSVDEGRYFAEGNTAWQRSLTARVVALDPAVIPHSYRFLPDSLVRLLVFATDDYVFSRRIYRLLFQFLLLFSIHYLARLHLGPGPALGALLLYALVYPASIRYYAGQLTDPMSHLSFVLAFIFLELRSFRLVALSVLAGLLAKESVLAVAIYCAIFEREGRRRLVPAAFLLGAAVLVLLAIRRAVAGGLEYGAVSGVGLDHILANLKRWAGLRQLICTIGVLAPFVLLGWRGSALERPKRLILVLLPALVLSNLLFSWLHEARNFVPVLIPMALITAEYVGRLLGVDGEGGGQPGSAATG